MMKRHGHWNCTLACLLLVVGVTGTGCTNLPGRDSLASMTAGGRHEASIVERLAKARALEDAEKLDEARKLYEGLIVEVPGRYEPYHRLGVVADRQKRHREAEALYTQAIERNASEPDLFNDLGYCYYLQGKLTKAESALLKAVAMSPSTPRYRNNLGLVFGQQGRYDEALEAFRHAGGEADAQYNLAFIFASQNNMQGAIACFRAALVADPTFEPARRVLENFERLEADPNAELANDPDVQDGIHWVPYVESNDAEAAVVQASHEAAMPAPFGPGGGSTFRPTMIRGTGANGGEMSSPAGPVLSGPTNAVAVSSQ